MVLLNVSILSNDDPRGERQWFDNNFPFRKRALQFVRRALKTREMGK